MGVEYDEMEASEDPDEADVGVDGSDSSASDILAESSEGLSMCSPGAVARLTRGFMQAHRCFSVPNVTY